VTQQIAAPVRRRPHSALGIAFYTQCRRWHGYLSAFAFLVLIFFSATGILLNHPDWLTSDGGTPRTLTTTIPLSAIKAAQKTQNAGAALGNLAAHNLSLLGSFGSADIEANAALLRFDGVKGSSDVTMNLDTGKVLARLSPADPVTMLDDLHRGKNAGAAWQLFIDISGVVILVLSLLGYILFFAMRFRLRTSLLLTFGSLALVVALFVFMVP
jgi:hypothetical protein